MTTKRKVEIFSAGCSACQDVIDLVNKISCPSCEVSVLDMHDEVISLRAKSLNINRLPAVVIDGKLADCCTDSSLSEQGLRAAGIGRAL